MKFFVLPQRSGEIITLALAILPMDTEIETLESHGWRLESPALVASPKGYTNGVTGSLGEFSCAKGVYVSTRCDWFSDRAACYLAAGRPVVVQDIRLADVLPTGEGHFAVRMPEEVTEALQTIRRNYPRHSKAARHIAVEHFDSAQVLSRLLAEVGIPQ